MQSASQSVILSHGDHTQWQRAVLVSCSCAAPPGSMERGEPRHWEFNSVVEQFFDNWTLDMTYYDVKNTVFLRLPSSQGQFNSAIISCVGLVSFPPLHTLPDCFLPPALPVFPRPTSARVCSPRVNTSLSPPGRVTASHGGTAGNQGARWRYRW